MSGLIQSDSLARGVLADGHRGHLIPERFSFRVFRLPVARINLAAALLAGFALRLFFVIRFPFSAGDTKFYDALAQNWLYHGVYGFFVNGQLGPPTCVPRAIRRFWPRFTPSSDQAAKPFLSFRRSLV